MRWFKHMTASADDEKLSRLKDEFGLEGYGFWWSVAEIVAAKVGRDAKTAVEFSPKKWGNSLGISPKKFRLLAEFCADIGLFAAEFADNAIRIDMPNILKYRDEWTERQHKNAGAAREKLPDRARAPDPDPETENKTTPQAAAGNKECARKQNAPQAERSDFSDVPGMEFQELRELYDREAKPEAPLAGFAEYKALRASRSWPGMGRITQGIDRLKREDAEWQAGFAPGLAKFLRERQWDKQPTLPRAGRALPQGPPAQQSLSPAEVARRKAEGEKMLDTLFAPPHKQKQARDSPAGHRSP